MPSTKLDMNSFRRILIKTGLLTRKPQINRKLDVQFFGHSGVGKTTLSKKAETLSEFSWGKMRRMRGRPAKKFYFMNSEVDEVYRALLKEKIRETLAPDAPSFIKARRVQTHIGAFVDDMSHRDGDELIGCWEDSGIIQKSTNALNAVRHAGLDLSKFLSNRIFVFLDAHADFILRNIRKRAAATGSFRLNNRSWMSDAELIESIEIERIQKREFYTFLREQGYQVLEIDPSQELEKNAVSVANFVDAEAGRL